MLQRCRSGRRRTQAFFKSLSSGSRQTVRYLRVPCNCPLLSLNDPTQFRHLQIQEYSTMRPQQWRKTTQDLAPVSHQPTPPGQYDLYPGFPVGSNKIGLGYTGLAQQLATQSIVPIDGFQGVFWDQLRHDLDAELRAQGIIASWTNVSDALQPEAAINAMIEPFLGGDDPIFGTCFTGELIDFFDEKKLAALKPIPRPNSTFSTVVERRWQDGRAHWSMSICPRTKFSFAHAPAASPTWVHPKPFAPKPMYKRFYFVDWVGAQPAQGRACCRASTIIVDGQRPD